MTQENNNRIFDKIDRLDEKFDRKMDILDRRLDSLDKQLAIYNVELQKHIEGVKLARTENALLKAHLDEKVKEIESTILPIDEHVKRVNTIAIFIAKIFGLISALVAIGAGIFEIIKK